MTTWPADYFTAITLFNDQEFFACHDVLEELWSETLGEERRFYQGLIHAAVSLFHFGNQNLGGARKMYDSSRNYLSPYCPEYMRIDLEQFLQEMECCFAELIEATEYPSGLRLDPARIPRIELKGLTEES